MEVSVPITNSVLKNQLTSISSTGRKRVFREAAMRRVYVNTSYEQSVPRKSELEQDRNSSKKRSHVNFEINSSSNFINDV